MDKNALTYVKRGGGSTDSERNGLPPKTLLQTKYLPRYFRDSNPKFSITFPNPSVLSQCNTAHTTACRNLIRPSLRISVTGLFLFRAQLGVPHL